VKRLSVIELLIHGMLILLHSEQPRLSIISLEGKFCTIGFP